MILNKKYILLKDKDNFCKDFRIRTINKQIFFPQSYPQVIGLFVGNCSAKVW